MNYIKILDELIPVEFITDKLYMSMRIKLSRNYKDFLFFYFRVRHNKTSKDFYTIAQNNEFYSDYRYIYGDTIEMINEDENACSFLIKYIGNTILCEDEIKELRTEIINYERTEKLKSLD